MSCKKLLGLRLPDVEITETFLRKGFHSGSSKYRRFMEQDHLEEVYNFKDGVLEIRELLGRIHDQKIWYAGNCTRPWMPTELKQVRPATPSSRHSTLMTAYSLTCPRTDPGIRPCLRMAWLGAPAAAAPDDPSSRACMVNRRSNRRRQSPRSPASRSRGVCRTLRNPGGGRYNAVRPRRAQESGLLQCGEGIRRLFWVDAPVVARSRDQSGDSGGSGQ